MPGFNVNGAGGTGPSNMIEIRRKHRWTFTVLGNFSQQELLVLQKASRPSFEFEEPELHHNQEHAYFAGKQKWDPVTLVWYDIEQDPDISAAVYRWLGTVVDLNTVNVAHPSTYKKQAQLQSEDGFGRTDETWIMYGCWPKSVNWQELDYGSTDLQSVEASMRYDRAIRQCINVSGATATQSNCG